MRYYVIKSITSNSYYCGIEPLQLPRHSKRSFLRYRTYWSQHVDDASLFRDEETANKCIVFLHGLMNDEEELTAEEVER